LENSNPRGGGFPRRHFQAAGMADDASKILVWPVGKAEGRDADDARPPTRIFTE
jgi:hypothetical protein